MVDDLATDALEKTQLHRRPSNRKTAYLDQYRSFFQIFSGETSYATKDFLTSCSTIKEGMIARRKTPA
jgi:hypothetical protein